MDVGLKKTTRKSAAVKNIVEFQGRSESLENYIMSALTATSPDKEPFSATSVIRYIPNTGEFKSKGTIYDLSSDDIRDFSEYWIEIKNGNFVYAPYYQKNGNTHIGAFIIGTSNKEIAKKL